MESAVHFINRKQQEIAQYHRRASKLRIWGWILKGPVGFVVWIAGAAALLTGFVCAMRSFLFFGQRIFIFDAVWQWMNMNYPVIWGVLQFIAPVPPIIPEALVTTSSLSLLWAWLAWVVVWTFLIWGFVSLGRNAINGSRALRKKANDAAEKLEFYEPVLMLMQGNSIGVSGDGNIVNAFNTINNVLHSDEGEKDWWTRPIGSIVIGVIINVICKFFGVL